jgi:hypothetical protein
MTDIFLAHFWPGLVVWLALYVSDYAFTIACARLYRGQDKIVFEGSYEITPVFQKDVDALRRLSPRFLLAMAAGSSTLWVLWWLTRIPPGWPAAYLFALGALVLLQLTVHVRHLRNWFLYRKALGPDGLQGRILHPRPMMLRSSAFEFAVFAGLYLLLFLITLNPFLLGGSAGCLATARKHLSLAKKHTPTT